MISQSTIRTHAPLRPIITGAAQQHGVSQHSAHTGTSVDLQLGRRAHVTVNVISTGIPIVAHPYTLEICRQEDTDFVADVESSILLLAPHLRKARCESMSPLIKWFCICEGSWRALETLYTYGEAELPGKPSFLGADGQDPALRFFRASVNAKGARERSRIVAELISRSIRGASTGLPIKIVSVASGSARAVLTGVRDAGRPVNIRLIDNNRLSLPYSSQQLVTELGVAADITCVLGSVQDISQHLGNGDGIHVAEAVGILDYFPDEGAIQLLAGMKDHLAEGGVIIASNIMDNGEREFLHTAVGWRPMYYRTIEEFLALFIRVGFDPHDLMVHVTPSDAVYAVVEAKRTL